jgi:hypothetical protein
MGECVHARKVERIRQKSFLEVRENPAISGKSGIDVLVKG